MPDGTRVDQAYRKTGGSLRRQSPGRRPRIRVQDIYVWRELQGRSPDEIVGDFPQLSLGDVHAAPAYYWDNPEEIQREMIEEAASLEQLKRTSASPLRKKLGFKDTSED